ncbi:hypothetical protein Bhyg_09363 [Pseudolycoriella hygida]|uniref:Uncharacterized protein n=1 Tax=Pseudolycoriella hygida TaxID=35572 RepID=A0A9Q0N860_9DIPT|nr:hypothetical protein Bhyg_09363 [Pseudolycoriella hygida]
MCATRLKDCNSLYVFAAKEDNKKVDEAEGSMRVFECVRTEKNCDYFLDTSLNSYIFSHKTRADVADPNQSMKNACCPPILQ